jgi:hypothetical protein
MTLPSEREFLDFLKQAAPLLESNEDESTAVGGNRAYADPPNHPAQNTEAVTFSGKAQQTSQDVRQGTTDRLLSSKANAKSVDRALIGKLYSNHGEAHSLQLAPEKVSHVRQETLMESVGRLCGRV